MQSRPLRAGSAETLGLPPSMLPEPSEAAAPEKRPAMQSEVESIIWEADEDCDQCLTWEEFQSMYHRCRNSQTGAPPVLQRTSLHHAGLACPPTA